MISAKRNDETVDKGFAIRLVRGIWHSCIDGLVMHGACMHGYPAIEDLRHDAEQLAESEQISV
jgi:hypothetical protein